MLSCSSLYESQVCCASPTIDIVTQQPSGCKPDYTVLVPCFAREGVYCDGVVKMMRMGVPPFFFFCIRSMALFSISFQMIIFMDFLIIGVIYTIYIRVHAYILNILTCIHIYILVYSLSLSVSLSLNHPNMRMYLLSVTIFSHIPPTTPLFLSLSLALLPFQKIHHVASPNTTNAVQCEDNSYDPTSLIYARALPCLYVSPTDPKDWDTALLLSVFLGMFGIDRYVELFSMEDSHRTEMRCAHREREREKMM